MHRRLSGDTAVAAVPKHLSSKVTTLDNKALLSLRCLSTSPLGVKYCIKSLSALLVCLAFALPTELPLPQLIIFQVEVS